MTARLRLTRAQILAFRRRVGALDERLPRGEGSLRVAAWAGLQDSMPRAALLSLHARVARTTAATWEHPSLVQVWGPRFSTYVVAARDRAIFTVSRTPDDPAARRFASEQADRLERILAGRRMTYGAAGRALGVSPNSLRYATTTGRVLLRWDGARRPEVWTVPAPEVSPDDARDEMLRRYLHVFGPGTAESFGRWAGIRPPLARAALDRVRRSLLAVSTPLGERWMLAADETALRTAADPPAAARLLPSGDTYYLLQGDDRALLVSDAVRRSQLWTSRVWPGALLLAGEIAGVWRRAGEKVSIASWRRLTRTERGAVEAEATALPLPDLARPISVRWEG